MAQIEESVTRYLHQLDSADRQEPSLATSGRGSGVVGYNVQVAVNDALRPASNKRFAA